MDEWWRRNKDAFQKEKMVFSGQACITATRGKFRKGAYMFEQEYEESRTKVRKLIGDCCRGVRWKAGALSTTIHTVKNTLNFWPGKSKVPPYVLSQLLYEALTKYGGVSEMEANKIKTEVESAEEPELTPLPSATVQEVPAPPTPFASATNKPASLSSTPSTAEKPLASVPAEETPTSFLATLGQTPLVSAPSTTEQMASLTSALAVGQTSLVSDPATIERPSIESVPVTVKQKPHVSEDFNAGSIPNVVIFGEVGVGKSSVVNMIAGRQVAQPSIGCTYQSEPHAVTLGATLVKLWVTTGLNEEDAGTARAKHTIVDLYKLLQRLEDGISLLVYCVRGPGINLNSITRNYRMFYHGLCQRNVPIVLVVTGLEGEHPMDAWWPMNNAIFQQQQMVFSGQACITATRGQFKAGAYAFEKEYEESRTKVQKLIGDCSRGAQRKIRASNWVVDTVKSTINIFSRMLNVPLRGLSSSLHEVLTDYGGFSEEQAQKIVDEVEAGNSPADDEKRNPWSEMYDWTQMI
jgi:hypothetical protein